MTDVYISELLMGLRPKLGKIITDGLSEKGIAFRYFNDSKSDYHLEALDYTKYKRPVFVFWNGHSHIQEKSFIQLTLMKEGLRNTHNQICFENGYDNQTYYCDAVPFSRHLEKMHSVNIRANSEKKKILSEGELHIFFSQSKEYDKGGIGYNPYPAGMDSLFVKTAKMFPHSIVVMHPNSVFYKNNNQSIMSRRLLIDNLMYVCGADNIDMELLETAKLNGTRINLHTHSSTAPFNFARSIYEKDNRYNFKINYWTLDEYIISVDVQPRYILEKDVVENIINKL